SHQQHHEAGEVAPAEDPALEPGARPAQQERDEHHEAGAAQDPHRARGEAPADVVQPEPEAAHQVDQAVDEVPTRGDPEAVVESGAHACGRNRPPHFARTSASSSGVTTGAPSERAYASTAFTTMPRANEGIACSRSRAAGSQVS